MIIQLIIPKIRMETFKDIHILFSGVIPTNTPIIHESTEIWRMARAFGATCHKDMVDAVTHVVTSKVLQFSSHQWSPISDHLKSSEEHRRSRKRVQEEVYSLYGFSGSKTLSLGGNDKTSGYTL